MREGDNKEKEDKRIGNEFYKLRDRMGREPEYTPDELREKFIQYVEWAKNNPRYIVKKIEFDVFGGEVPIKYPLERPLSIEGFCSFIDISRQTFLNYEKREEKDYFEVLSRVRTYMQSDQIEGAMVGIYKENITARINGLSDKVDSKLSGDKENPIEHNVKGKINLESIVSEFMSEENSIDEGNEEAEGSL